ncbi:excinuclease ABC subunit UvrB [Patescibacteria group bacterium]|jgi:excinuclease ABC subunit B|nr:excinuclease ABC subunit UvrB [Patescibacteria group bacterium]
MPDKFVLKSKYEPSGDQPEAIRQLIGGVEKGYRFQTLLGATGTGKTFTIANVIEKIQKPTLVIAHNKTLAAQLCNEFRHFFPDNAVEYFVSYYDYYQPEAYIARSDTYIEKEAMINQEIDRLRHNATQALITRKDVLIVATVSCIYGLGAPEAYEKIVLRVKKEDDVSREGVMQRLIDMQFTRTPADLTRGTFRARGEVLELMPANEEMVYRIEAPRGIVSRIEQIDPVTKKIKREQEDVWVFPAKHFIIAEPERLKAIGRIRQELKERLEYLEKKGMLLEAERLERRTKYDLEMIETLGYCNGIENYSQPLSGRAPGEPPDTLFSYFPEDFLLVIDESHVTTPQLGGMYEGDRSRKQSLIEHGFRLPSAADNRPLRFTELEKKMKQVIFVSATPSKYEMEHSAQVVEQIIRPTGLVDPEIIVMPITPDKKTGYQGQVEDLLSNRIPEVLERKERVLVTTLTKKMAEDLTEFMKERKLKVRYIHSDIDTIERLEILSEFRKGTYDIIVGVNLLREGLDLPEVSLVAILDADKEGFLRSETSLIQTIGRAARNVKGQVLLYADNMTGSLERAMKETERRRTKQLAYNKEHGITPKTIIKAQEDLREMLGLAITEKDVKEILKLELSGESHDLEVVLKKKEKEMKEAAKNLEFELAAILRDEVMQLEKEIRKRTKASPLPAAEQMKVRKKRELRHGRTK